MGDPEELSLAFARPPGRAEYPLQTLYGYSVSTEVERSPTATPGERREESSAVLLFGPAVKDATDAR